MPRLPPQLTPGSADSTHGLGCCYSGWLLSPQSTAAAAGPARARQEQQHPSLCSPHAAPESLLHPQNQLSFHPWALAVRFTKSGGQRDGATSLLSGWRRWKEVPVLRDAPLGRGDEPWSRAEVPLSRRTLPSSPRSQGRSDRAGRHFLPPQPRCRHAACIWRTELPHTSECKSPSKIMQSANASLQTPATGELSWALQGMNSLRTETRFSSLLGDDLPCSPGEQSRGSAWLPAAPLLPARRCCQALLRHRGARQPALSTPRSACRARCRPACRLVPSLQSHTATSATPSGEGQPFFPLLDFN